MSNTILTPTTILRKAGQLFHQKARFIGSIDRQYDDRFSKRGAKIGDTLALRDPVAFSVTTSRIMAIQDVTEFSQNLTVGTQKHVAFKFTASDLSLKVDDFAQRYLEKAMAKLASSVESDVLSTCRRKVGNFIDDDGNALSYLDIAKGKQKLIEHLADDDGSLNLLMSPEHATKYMDATKGLFTPSGKLGSQYGDGQVKDALGFNVMTSTLQTPHTTGTAVKGDTTYDLDIATAAAGTEDGTGTNPHAGANLKVKTGATTFKNGDVIELESVNEVHPESKTDLGYRKQFTVTADYAGGGGLLAIYPACVTSGPYQNVSAAPADGKALFKVGAGNAETYKISLAYAPEAFVFATADLEDPSRYGQWGATEVMDKLSMRIWRSADIVNDEFPCRIDVFYGSLARYPELACRIHADG